MKKLLIFIVTFFALIDSEAQLGYDTISLEPVIKGSMMLQGSSRIGRARVYGYYFEEFSMLACGSGEEIDGKSKICQIESIDSTWLIKISIETNCCSSILSEIQIVEDSILNIIYHDYGIICECECNYCMDYKICYSPTRIQQSSKYLKKDLFVKYAMINWDKSTLINIASQIRKN